MPSQKPGTTPVPVAIASSSGLAIAGLDLGFGNDDPFSLPCRSAADRMADAYFSFRHPLNPYLHQGTFRERYNRLWLSADVGGEEVTGSSLAWLGLVNMVFAFGSEYTKSNMAGRPSTDRSHFFNRARTLIFSSLLQAPSIELVQALLLMGQYLHGSLELDSCWTVIGMANRIAQGQGLHLDPSTFTLDVIEQEIRKRVWWGCFVTDRILSMKVGRAPTIRDDPSITAGLPLAIDDKHLTNDQSTSFQPPGIPSKLEFLIQAIGQCRLFDRILETLYNAGSLHDQTDPKRPTFRLADLPKCLAAAIQLDGDLTSWEQSLPPHLQSGSDVQDWHFQRQRSVLLMRWVTQSNPLFLTFFSLLPRLLHRTLSRYAC